MESGLPTNANPPVELDLSNYLIWRPGRVPSTLPSTRTPAVAGTELIALVARCGSRAEAYQALTRYKSFYNTISDVLIYEGKLISMWTQNEAEFENRTSASRQKLNQALMAFENRTSALRQNLNQALMACKYIASEIARRFPKNPLETDASVLEELENEEGVSGLLNQPLRQYSGFEEAHLWFDYCSWVQNWCVRDFAADRNFMEHQMDMRAGKAGPPGDELLIYSIQEERLAFEEVYSDVEKNLKELDRQKNWAKSERSRYELLRERARLWTYEEARLQSRGRGN